MALRPQPLKPTQPVRAPSSRPWGIVLAGVALLLLAFAAYHNSFSVPMLMDDLSALDSNTSIGRLSDIGEVLFPSNDTTTRGRPLLNLSFAVNFAFGQIAVRGYHVGNLLIHALAALALFGITRRTLALPKPAEKFGAVATPLAFFIAAVWLAHPLLTESVTYISQRAEELMGLCYFLTLYWFIRGATSSAPRRFYVLAVVACAAGMMSKEVMVTAPLIILFYDRAFLSGTFPEAWRKRKVFYLGLAATWVVLAAVMLRFNVEDRGIGFHDKFTWWTYGLTECKVVVQYLKLAFWPAPLIFDYGPELFVREVQEIVPQALLLVLLLTGTLISWRRWPAFGFVASWFFVILAPTSTIIPIVTQPMAESRMYLPLAAIVALVVVGLYAWLGRKSFAVLAVLVVGFAFLTVRRNADYRDEFTLWTDTVNKRPENSRSQNALGHAYSEMPGYEREAIAHFETALRLDPYHARAHGNLARVLVKTPSTFADGIRHYEEAIRLEPTLAETHYNFANALATVPGRLPDAIAHYETSIRLDPDFAESHVNLANALSMVPGRLNDMVIHYKAALRIKPEMVQAYYNMGVALSDDPLRRTEAIASLEAALRIDPDSERARELLKELRAR